MKTAVILAHPKIEQSKVNKYLVAALKAELKDVLVHDLYQSYPNWKIDVAKEQQILASAERIVLQFPMHWYSVPALAKLWMDDVLTYGWAFGPGGDKLRGKEFLCAVSCGSTEESMQAGGFQCFTVSEFLRPIQQTFQYVGGRYLPAFVYYGAMTATPEEVHGKLKEYLTRLHG